MTLRHEEVAAPPFQFAHAAAREPTDTLALLIIKQCSSQISDLSFKIASR